VINKWIEAIFNGENDWNARKVRYASSEMATFKILSEMKNARSYGMFLRYFRKNPLSKVEAKSRQYLVG
jgi:hypothetical protein